MAKTPSERDAIDVLMEDHKRVQKLFKDFDRVEREDAEAVRDLVETACVELQIHSMLEEELFYPAVRAQVEDDDERNQDLLNEAEVEHESVEEIIAKLQDLEADDPLYFAYFSVLAEYVKHHIKEEEKELFPEVKKMKALDLQQLAEDMRVRREELFAEIAEAGQSEAANESTSAQASRDALSETETEESEDEQEQIDISRTRH
ncbi:MAG TPA: hemerythrin domain-containing protein [Burkholderiales bacterium]|jgi:iron-sulfur cluster repair protein YtfE (RIC family)|nr:hemerythrin domain-containing protein [Burkholderiales bacterium]